MKICNAVIVGVVWAVATSGAIAQTLEDHELWSNPANPYDAFGKAVSIDGNRAIVGAPYFDPEDGSTSFAPITSAGAAFIFEFDGSQWNQTAFLTASDADPGDNFGSAVAIHGDRVVVGARQAEEENYPLNYNSGAAYVFHFDGTDWVEEARFDGEGGEDDYVGTAVSIYGDTVAVSAPNRNAYGQDSGTIYMHDFDGSQWNLTQVIQPNDPWSQTKFGTSCSLGDGVLISHRVEGNSNISRAGVYIFRHTPKGWVQEIKLFTSNEHIRSTAIYKDRAVMSSTQSGGSVFVYKYDGSTWNQSDQLLSEADPQWVSSVDISDEIIVLGNENFDSPGFNNNGAAFVFEYDGSAWSKTHTLLASDGDDDHKFGHAVSCSNGVVMIGGSVANYALGGSAYAFHLAGPVDSDGDGIADDVDNCDLPNPDQADCNGNGIGDVCDLADGTSDDVNGNSVPDECECLGDIDSDGEVDIADLLLVIADFGTSDGGPTDINGDGSVSVADILALVNSWGTCE